MTSTYRKKLIEVALPLEAINVASAREKSIRHGHPSTLHLWWARRPLAACRAVLFASLVNDPEDDPMYGISEDVAYTERAKLFDLIEELVQWDNSNNPRVINAARLEIARSIAANKVADKELNDDTPLVANSPKLSDEQTKYLPESPPEYTPRDVRFKMPTLKPEQVNHFLVHYAPPVLDPFAGGGSIPLEAQRLGLRAYASDLNPVPVLINKALIEIPPKFAGQPPINPAAKDGKLSSKVWQGATGLAEDVRYYGKWMRAEAERRIGHLYPKVAITQEMVNDQRPDLKPWVGQELTVIAWLWARTVPSPSPAHNNCSVPLLAKYWLSTKVGREAYLSPEVAIDQKSYVLHVRTGKPDSALSVDSGTKIGRGGNFSCLLSNVPIPVSYIREMGKEGKIGTRLTSLVVDAGGKRVYVSPTSLHNQITTIAKPDDYPNESIAQNPRDIRCQLYGLTEFGDLFTPRQLLMLMTFSNLVGEAKAKVVEDGGDRSSEYADAVATYLGLAIGKMVDYNCSLVTWIQQRDQAGHAMTKQAIPMVWDFAEVNPLVGAAGDITVSLNGIAKTIEASPASTPAVVVQRDATTLDTNQVVMVSTDPPYYDNIGYADLSDFFYVWLRRGLVSTYPQVCSTVLTPKASELIATPYRHNNSKVAAKEFFETGLGEVIRRVKAIQCDSFPVTIYYAFKQTESALEGDSSTGWETMLTGVITSGFSITGTWPMRTERETRSVGQGTNALASSIILVCRPRAIDATMVTRRDFANALRHELPEAIRHLQSGNVAPVDLAQASIGPGMAVFSRYSRVINADGAPMTVREALQLINQVLDESLVEQESDFDSETRFALKWFEQYGLGEGPFGDAENLSKAMAVSVKGIEDAGILRSKAGKVRLLKREELDQDWDPASDTRLTMWEVAQHLIRTLETDGEAGTADLLRRIGSEKGDIARELAYRLYQTCERKSLAKEAGAYNALVVSWPEISRLSRQKSSTPKQSELELTD